MNSALWTLQHIIDDYGNAIQVCKLLHATYKRRACFFHQLGWDYANSK